MFDDIQRIYKQLQNFQTRLEQNIIPYTLIKPMENMSTNIHPADIIKRIIAPIGTHIDQHSIPFRPTISSAITQLKDVQSHFIIPELAQNIRDLEHHLQEYPYDLLPLIPEAKHDTGPKRIIFEDIVYKNGRIEKRLHLNGRVYAVRSKVNDTSKTANMDAATDLSTLVLEDYDNYKDDRDSQYGNKYGFLFDALCCLCPEGSQPYEIHVENIVDAEEIMLTDGDKPAGIKLPRLKPLKTPVVRHDIYYSDGSRE